MGAAYLGVGEDRLAKESFDKALESDPLRQDTTLNLAGLYQHYGHLDEANNLYESLSGLVSTELNSDLIHPRAKKLFDARNVVPTQANSGT